MVTTAKVVDLDLTSITLESLRDLVFQVRDSDTVLVLRGLDTVLGLSECIDFLGRTCGLILDRRHYSLTENLEHQDWWEISYQPEKAISYAYSNTKQPFHSDNAWFSDPAELNFFLMQKQAKKGGEQFIYSVNDLVCDLGKMDPTLLKSLLNTDVLIQKGSGDYFNRGPIIRQDYSGYQIYWNYYRTVRESTFIERLCEDFFGFLSEQETSAKVQYVHLNSGDGLIMNDTRNLHGRSAFEAKQSFDRILLQSMWKCHASM